MALFFWWYMFCLTSSRTAKNSFWQIKILDIRYVLFLSVIHAQGLGHPWPAKNQNHLIDMEFQTFRQYLVTHHTFDFFNKSFRQTVRDIMIISKLYFISYQNF